MIAVLLALVIGASPPLEGEVRGRVTDLDTGEPVAGAVVNLAGTAVSRSARTGTDGEYAFKALAPGSYRIHVGHPGYDAASVRVLLRASGDLIVDVPLALRPIEVAPIHVAAEPAGASANGEAPLPADSAELAVRARRPGGLGPQGASALADMVAGAVARNDDHGQNGGRNAHVLYIWGSSGERGRVLLDGATINGPLHLGGMLAPVDPDVLSSAELRTGGVSPRHDGGTTYVMDFATRPARSDAAHAFGEVDLLTTRFGIETPLGADGGAIVSARRVNDELVDRLLDRPFGYGYADVLARADAGLGSAGRLQGTFFTTRESIVIPRDFEQDDAAWRNVAAGLTWHAPAGSTIRNVRLSYGRGSTALPLLSAPGGRLRASVERLAASAERAWTIGRARGVLGAEVEHMRFDRAANADSDPTAPVSDPVACTQNLPCATLSSSAVAAFGEASWQLGRSWSARAGARLAYDGATGGVTLLPRASLTALVGDDAFVTVSAGRFSQPYAAAPPAGAGESAPAADATVALAHATHLEVNVVRRTGRTALAATAFVRQHEAGTTGTDGRATPGLDVSWTYDAPRFNASIGYSYTRMAGVLADAYGRNRHLAALGIGTSLGPFVAQASAAYGDGLPLASVVLEDPAEARAELLEADITPTGLSSAEAPRTLPDRSYLRLDASIGAELNFRAGGRDVALTPYLKVLNALRDRDALFYYHDAAVGGSPRPLATLPAIPVFGLRWSF